MIDNIPEKIVIKSNKSLKEELVNCGLKASIFNIAKKANLNLTHLFYDNILKYCNGYYDLSNEMKENADWYISKGKEEMASKLYGVLGNYYAYHFFKSNGFDVELEASILDNGELKSKPDLCLSNSDGNCIYCEVKTISQIIDNVENYKDLDDNNLSYRDNTSIIKYQAVGEKLLKQLRKLKQYCKAPMAIVYRDCVIDNDILKKIKIIGAVIYRIPNRSFLDIEKEVDDYLNTVIDHFKNDVILEEMVVSKTSRKRNARHK